MRDGTTLPAADVTRSVRLGAGVVEDAADLSRIVGLAADGATIVLQGLQQLWTPLQRFTGELEEATSHRVQANAYLSPPGASGLRHHADTHEVLVLQVEGEKAWRVDGLGELTLHAGDVLYLPAGTGHSAAAQEQHSLHITIGLLARSYRQVLQRLIDDQEELAGDLCRWASPGPAGPRKPRGGAGPGAQGEPRRGWQRKSPTPSRHGRCSARGGGPGPNPAAPCARCSTPRPSATRPACAGRARSRSGSWKTVTRSCWSAPGRRLRGPAALRPALEVVLERNELRVADLAGLDEASRAVLARRLLRVRVLPRARRPPNKAGRDGRGRVRLRAPGGYCQSFTQGERLPNERRRIIDRGGGPPVETRGRSPRTGLDRNG